MLDSVFGKLDFTTSQNATRRVIEILQDRQLTSGKFYDLGSCRGGFAFKLIKALPMMQVTGIDDSYFRIFLSKAGSIFKKKLNFRHGNIFNADLSSADVIYIYLPQELMPELQIKLQKELKPGALVITHSVSFSFWPPVEEHPLENDTARIKKLFVYVKN